MVEPGSPLLRPIQSKELPASSKAMTSDGAGGFWITSTGQGLFHWKADGSVDRFSLRAADGIENPAMTGVLLDAEGRVWVSHHRGLSVLEPGGRELRNVQAQEAGRPYVFDLVQDVSEGPGQTLWLGTMKGVLSFDENTRQIRRFQHDPLDRQSLSDNYILQTFTDRAGNLWVGTRAGLNRLIRDPSGRLRFRRYGLEDGLPDITIDAIVGDSAGRVWIATSRGVAYWERQRDRFQSYLAADGIPRADVNMKSAALGADGALYFGTLGGLWAVVPSDIRPADAAPVVLSSFEVGSRKTINLQGEKLSTVTARYSDDRVVFHIAVLGDARRLSYRLSGLESEWSALPNDRAINYSRLSPGEYELQIRQQRADGSWGPGKRITSIEILPPLWRTGWAYALYVVALIGLLLLAVRRYSLWRNQALRAQLQESNARLSIALHAARFGMWAWDVASDKAELDANSRKILAVSTGTDAVGDVFERMHPDDVDPIRARVDEALRSGDVKDFEFRLFCEGEGWRWIEGHLAPYPTPRRSSYVIGVHRDATQRKHELIEIDQARRTAERTLAELKQSRMDLAMALESGQLGVWRADRPAGAAPGGVWRTATIECDANVRTIFGWPAGVDIGARYLYRSLHREDRRRVMDLLRRVAGSGGAYTDQYRIVHPGGVLRYVSVRAIYARNEHPKPGGFFTGIVHDVTNEETLKSELKQAAEQAQQATRAKSDFLAMMSHEIRTPINGIVGTVDLLSEVVTEENQAHLLRLCRESAFVLQTVVADILDFSKIEAGKLELENAPISPRRLVESVAESFRAQVREKGLDLDVLIAPNVPRRVMGDRVRLRQVLGNLVGNAVKFTEKGGVTIRVRLSCEDASYRRSLRFDVVDSGIGIDGKRLEVLFNPFQQADVSTTRRFGGTGLGLTIVKRLVALMGGQVECFSSAGVGSCFSVAVPVERCLEAPKAQPGAFQGLRAFVLCKDSDRTQLLLRLCGELGLNARSLALDADLAERIFPSPDAPPRDSVLIVDKGCADRHDDVRRMVRGHPHGAAMPIVFVRGEAIKAEPTPDPHAVLVAGSPLTSQALAAGLQLLRDPQIAGAGGGSAPSPRPRSFERSRPDRTGTAAQILVAEDNPTNSDVITRQLLHLGFSCDVAADGEQAWSMLRSHPGQYKILLTDCHMPVLDGYQLAERIRRDENARGAPRIGIVFVTADALQSSQAKSGLLGDGFLAKPVQMRDLRDLLNKMLAPAVAADAADPIADSPELASLVASVGGSRASLRRVLNVFIATTVEDLGKWDAACGRNDALELRELAHKLKSSCRLIGDQPAGLALERVERHQGEADEWPELTDQARNGLVSAIARARHLMATLV